MRAYTQTVVCMHGCDPCLFAYDVPRTLTAQMEALFNEEFLGRLHEHSASCQSLAQLHTGRAPLALEPASTPNTHDPWAIGWVGHEAGYHQRAAEALHQAARRSEAHEDRGGGGPHHRKAQGSCLRRLPGPLRSRAGAAGRRKAHQRPAGEGRL